MGEVSLKWQINQDDDPNEMNMLRPITGNPRKQVHK